MIKKAAKKTKIEESTQKGTSFFDYLRFGESYTSLILGIIVVIIATALLLSFVHNKDAGNVNTPITQQTQNTVQVSQKADNLAQKAPGTASDTISTPEPTNTIAPTDTVVPTAKPTTAPKPTAKPTAASKPKLVVKPKLTHGVIKIAKATPSPIVKAANKPTPKTEKKIAVTFKSTPAPQIINVKNKSVWIVQKNESLWTIAEKKYTSGYNWVDIAKANNLADPSDIHVGDKLVLPNVTPGPSTLVVEKPTVTTDDQQFSSTKRDSKEITSKTYTVVHGDTLWNIAVRAYGDGYKWTDIEKANNLVNPGLIFSGNVLTIPR